MPRTRSRVSRSSRPPSPISSRTRFRLRVRNRNRNTTQQNDTSIADNNQEFTCSTCHGTHGFVNHSENESNTTLVDRQADYGRVYDAFMSFIGGPTSNRRGSRGNRRRGGRRGTRGGQIDRLQELYASLRQADLDGVAVTFMPNGSVIRGTRLGSEVPGGRPYENQIQDFVGSLREPDLESSVGGRGRPEVPQQNQIQNDIASLNEPDDSDSSMDEEEMELWGRLQSVLGQLLNEMNSNGAPPLTKEEIQKIPIELINQDQVDSSLKCSVCWEVFNIREVVRVLICQHIYHDHCISPWLELHATCPICRKTLSQEDRSDEIDLEPEEESIFPDLDAVLRTITESARSLASSPSSVDSSISISYVAESLLI